MLGAPRIRSRPVTAPTRPAAALARLRALVTDLAVAPPMPDPSVRAAFDRATRARSARALSLTALVGALLFAAAAAALALHGAASARTALATAAIAATLAATAAALARPSSWPARHPAATLLAAVVLAALAARLAPAADLDPRSWRGLTYLLPFATVTLFVPPARRAVLTLAAVGAWAALTWSGGRLPPLTPVEVVVYAVLLGFSTALSVGVGHLLHVLAARQHLDDVALDDAAARLSAEVAAQRAALHASHDALVARRADERVALARELHDSTGQTLTALRLELELAAPRATTMDDEIRLGRLAGKLDRVVARVRALLDDLVDAPSDPPVPPPEQPSPSPPVALEPLRLRGNPSERDALSGAPTSAPRPEQPLPSPPVALEPLRLRGNPSERGALSGAPASAPRPEQPLPAFAAQCRRAALDRSRAFALVLAAVILAAWPTDALLPAGMAVTLLPMRVLGTLGLLVYALTAHRAPPLRRHPALSLALLTLGALALTISGGHTMALDGPWSDQILLLPMASILVPTRPLPRAAMAFGMAAAFVIGFFAAFPDQLTSDRAALLIRDLGAAALVATAIGHGVYRLQWRRFLAAHAVATANATMAREVAAQTRELREVAARAARLAQDARERTAERLAAEVERPLAALRRDLADDPPDALTPAEIARLVGHLDALADQLDRACRDLGPRPLDQRSLPEALRAMCDDARAAGAPVETTLAAIPADPPTAVARAFYRVAQEALTNALKHSGATRIAVTLATTGAPGGLRLTIADDGRGDGQKGTALPTGGAGLGIASMRARAAAIGARLELARDAGVRVTLIWAPPAG